MLGEAKVRECMAVIRKAQDMIREGQQVLADSDKMFDRGYELMTDIPATPQNCRYYERLARVAETMGELDPDQATILSEVCISSALHRNKLSGLKKEELADLRTRASITKFQAHRTGLAGAMLADKYAIFKAMTIWGL